MKLREYLISSGLGYGMEVAGIMGIVTNVPDKGEIPSHPYLFTASLLLYAGGRMVSEWRLKHEIREDRKELGDKL